MTLRQRPQGVGGFYKYELTEPAGRNFHPDFQPELTPKQMLSLGVFGGKYMTDCQKEFPKSWFTKAKLSPKHHDDSLNYFHQHASQPLGVWEEKGWINKQHDPRGWFQWYCRYYMGRRLPEEDEPADQALESNPKTYRPNQEKLPLDKTRDRQKAGSEMPSQAETGTAALGV